MAEKSQNADSGKEKKGKKIYKKEKTIQQQKGLPTLSADLKYCLKDKTNHLISSKSHPSATENTAIHSLKIGRGATKPTGTLNNFDKV